MALHTGELTLRPQKGTLAEPTAAACGTGEHCVLLRDWWFPQLLKKALRFPQSYVTKQHTPPPQDAPQNTELFQARIYHLRGCQGVAGKMRNKL